MNLQKMIYIANSITKCLSKIGIRRLFGVVIKDALLLSMVDAKSNQPYQVIIRKVPTNECKCGEFPTADELISAWGMK